MLRGERDDGAFKVVEATTLPPWTEDTDLTVVGRRASRVEGEAKITGRARYAYEMRLPDQLYACVLRSPYPHARLRRPRPGHLTSTRKEILRANRSAMSGVIWRRVCVRQIS
jgi:hypothetical protein